MASRPGEFNKYIFFLAANLVDSLEMEYNPGTEIQAAATGDEDERHGPGFMCRQGRGGQTRGLHDRDV